MSVLTRFITTTDFWYYNYIFSSLVWHTGVRKLMSLATFHAHTRLIAESHVIWGSQGVTHREEDCLCWWWDLTPYCKIRLPHRWLQDPAEVNWHVQEVHSTENTTPDTGERTSSRSSSPFFAIYGSWHPFELHYCPLLVVMVNRLLCSCSNQIISHNSIFTNLD